MTRGLLRRALLKRAGAVAAWLGGGGMPAMAQPAGGDAKAFEATSLQDTLSALGGMPVDDAGIELVVADVNENGAIVPVSVTSRLAGTQEIATVAESNPTPLIVRFTIPEGTEAFVSTRVKMAQSGRIHAVVRAGGKAYVASRDTTVMVGGCG